MATTNTPDSLATEIQARMIARGMTVATAESCTGGHIGHRLTLIPGSSAYYVGGVIAYANSVKERILGVPANVLANPGAVSEPCARAMADGARRVTGADIAVATTGIAGPDGGSARKPVGTVFIGLATPAETIVEEHHFRGDRVAVIDAATTRALELLLDAAG